MKYIYKNFVVYLCLTISSYTVSAEIEDNFMQGIFQYLAKNRNMNAIAYSGEKVAEIGRLYYLEEPDKIGDLNRWTLQGVGLKLFLFENGQDYSAVLEFQKEESYVIGNKYADYLGAELSASLIDRGISINAFKNALRSATITFTVYRKLVPANLISSSIQPNKKRIIEQFENFGQGNALVIPFQELVITDFQYNEQSSSELEALLGADFLKNIKAKLSINLINTQNLAVSLPASATIAIKPFAVYFKSIDSPWWGEWCFFDC